MRVFDKFICIIVVSIGLKIDKTFKKQTIIKEDNKSKLSCFIDFHRDHPNY